MFIIKKAIKNKVIVFFIELVSSVGLRNVREVMIAAIISKKGLFIECP
jgi:hypothetical protein